MLLLLSHRAISKVFEEVAGMEALQTQLDPGDKRESLQHDLAVNKWMVWSRKRLLSATLT
jgi:hypothetical protein